MYAIRRELKLNNKERTLMAQCSGYSRFVYNYAMTLLKQSWSFESVKASDSKRLAAIKKVFVNLTKKRPEFNWCSQLSSRIYQNAFQALGKAFSRWRDPEQKAEMPTPKTKKSQQKFTVDSSNGLVRVAPGKKIWIPTLGTFRLKEAIPYTCASQTFTISKEGDKWFVSFALKACQYVIPSQPKDKVGVDLGVKCFATLSDGTPIEQPASLKRAKTKLGKLQWLNRNKVLGNRQKGVRASNNAKRFYAKLRRQHAAIKNARKDFLHKFTTDLAKTFRQIRIEDLNVKGMIANHKLAEAVSMQGFYETRRQLTYKQEKYGFLLSVIDRWYPSSKMCSECGHIQDMLLKERVYCCGNCGMVKDRDHNAAINIENWDLHAFGSKVLEQRVDRKEPTPLDESRR